MVLSACSHLTLSTSKLSSAAVSALHALLRLFHRAVGTCVLLLRAHERARQREKRGDKQTQRMRTPKRHRRTAHTAQDAQRRSDLPAGWCHCRSRRCHSEACGARSLLSHWSFGRRRAGERAYPEVARSCTQRVNAGGVLISAPLYSFAGTSFGAPVLPRNQGRCTIRSSSR